MMHWMAARALYSRTPERDGRCPGPDCGGYKASDPLTAAPHHRPSRSLQSILLLRTHVHVLGMFAVLIVVACGASALQVMLCGPESHGLFTIQLASQVLYGMDYLSSERDRQHAFLRSAVLDHLRRAPMSLLVIEEYDKLDCPTRAMLRQLIGSSRASNTSMARFAWAYSAC